ncbi:Rieske 2Fe-2S domain-containing protein [Pigmentiphaga sp. GD03639]|uniref:Rieske 2Fe-2S domain-containing protein n=1 Tax=Pigmentiphaga daeguensis TaxID=414049 RepID=A0ABN1BJ04_9BURK|nr:MULTISPECIES: Rieske 2Fe-2S domain-containing protein [unclassified Pigmentiphaga]MDH2234954.1 Rieske 2Fe-2S domain-containing protein [Pigmentiphaga sp. GD03639]OVZ62539.1 Rieske (2Fe-2S) protein [Pigmentiphaga sp. NML030171]
MQYREWTKGDLTRVPYWVYGDDAIYRQEQERIYQGDTWSFLGLEAELPESGDYKTTFVGDMPVIVCRDEGGVIRAFENRCSHRGSLLALQNKGKARKFTCVYHAWTHDLQGNLKTVAFRRGVNGAGGMPDSFDTADHGPRKLRVEVYCGLIFGTLSEKTPPVEEYLGDEVASRVKRVLHKPLRIYGQYTQALPNNWKLYFENAKDTYHSSLLHTFFATFKVSRLSQGGGVIVAESGGHHVSYSLSHSGGQDDEFKKEGLRSNQEENFLLNDKSVLNIVDEFGDGCHVQILSIFPGFVLQAIHNSLAVRQIVPKGPDRTDLVWTLIGFTDDDEALQKLRMKHSNLVGPAGYVSMEDGAVGGFVQRGIAGSNDAESVVLMGGEGAESSSSRASETSIRGFWKEYRNHMGL